MQPRLKQARGFTLIELLMTLAVSSLVIAGMAATFVSQAKQYQNHAAWRATQAHGRQGLIFMEDAIRQAGYGVAPWLAITPFDAFDASTNARVANHPDGVTVVARDPLWRRRVSALNTTTSVLAFQEPIGTNLLQGQILLVLGCGAKVSAYVTVASMRNANSVNLAVAGAVTETPITGPGSRFHEQGRLANGCLDSDQAHVVKVDRYSFYVDAFAERAGDPRAAWTPYLMMHRGLDTNGDLSINRSDAVPLVDNVEQLQLAYVLNTQGNNTPATRGVDPAEAGWGWGTAWDVALTRPAIESEYSDASRFTDHPANIRQLRLSVVTRGPSRDNDSEGINLYTPGEAYASGTFPTGEVAWRQLENLDGALPAPFDPSTTGYIRHAVRLSISPKNLLARSQFNPPTNGGG